MALLEFLDNFDTKSKFGCPFGHKLQLVSQGNVSIKAATFPSLVVILSHSLSPSSFPATAAVASLFSLLLYVMLL
uniref:Uncharacterized protein n=1 Tax=Panagrolaimus sp. ES5 TaxID=591445 RepID=A0AC34FXN9_9BILA